MYGMNVSCLRISNWKFGCYDTIDLHIRFIIAETVSRKLTWQTAGMFGFITLNHISWAVAIVVAVVAIRSIMN